MLSGLHSWSWKSGQISLMAFASSWIHHQELRRTSITHSLTTTFTGWGLSHIHIDNIYTDRNDFKWLNKYNSNIKPGLPFRSNVVCPELHVGCLSLSGWSPTTRIDCFPKSLIIEQLNAKSEISRKLSTEKI